MKLPNGEYAIIEEEKLFNYLLDPLHREGRHHAELFHRLLGIERESWKTLCAALQIAAKEGDATAGHQSNFGIKYEIRFP